jgi:hypothetical protein
MYLMVYQASVLGHESAIGCNYNANAILSTLVPAAADTHQVGTDVAGSAQGVPNGAALDVLAAARQLAATPLHQMQRAETESPFKYKEHLVVIDEATKKW